jgi:DNA-binding CsgD family transcriptional regulator
MAGSDSQRPLRGREHELDGLGRVVADVRSGRSRVLVLRGEAGIGKTALLQHLVERASGCRVVRAAGVESEMELAFAGLHQLCAPFLDRRGRLPAPQAEALGVAFGLCRGDAPDRFLVGLAVLTMMSEVAEERPLVCLVDDAHWLDRASAQTLAFVARRLAAESVALVFAVREPGGEDLLKGLPELAVRGLRHDDALALLDSVVTGPLDDRVRDRIVAEMRGNPLALLELPGSLGFEELAGGFGLSTAPAVAGRIEESFLRRLDTLPDDVRTLLVIAAAEPLGDPVLLWRAAQRRGVALSAADTVETGGLLAVEERVTFRHPLVRSAVYRSAPPSERRAAHRALAEATDRAVDPDRRAWHLAAAADGPDEDVARELERSAGRAQARGGLAAAAAFLQRAVALTDDPARRADRALAAAEASLQAGAFDAALSLLATAEVEELDELRRARVGLLRADAAFSSDRGSDGPSLLLDAAKTLEPLDPVLARNTYLDAWSAALFAGPLAGVSLHEVSQQALAAPRPQDPPRPSDLLLEGFALALTAGRRAAAPVLKRAAAGFDGPDVSVEEVLRWGWLATAAAVMVWDYDACLAVTAREVQVARDSGALTVLAVGANVLAQAACWGGDFGRAAFLVAEADAVVEATGTQVAPYGALLLGGMRGREPEARRLIDATIADATAGGQGIAVQYARWAAAILGNGLGRHEQALAAARAAAEDTPELFVSAWAASELVEAAVRTGDTDLARHALARLAEATAAAETDWARGVEARSRALLSVGDVADGLYREAIARLGRTRVRPELARAHLLYGEWLRHEERLVEARSQLRVAHELAAGIGMEAFAERARRELAAAGERVRDSADDARADLTAQESEIAQLAAAGRTNTEIGARLFLSPRTVEWHLRKVFTKLGIGSRRDLQHALGPAPRADLPD